MKSVPTFLQANQQPTVHARAIANRFKSAAWSFAFPVNIGARGYAGRRRGDVSSGGWKKWCKNGYDIGFHFSFPAENAEV
jgi:hypothetical protein